jgi:hypothetical protein
MIDSGLPKKPSFLRTVLAVLGVMLYVLSVVRPFVLGPLLAWVFGLSGLRLLGFALVQLAMFGLFFAAIRLIRRRLDAWRLPAAWMWFGLLVLSWVLSLLVLWLLGRLLGFELLLRWRLW